MARHLHFDCFNGISGDMTLGALVDLGLDVTALQKGLSGLPIGEFRLRAEKVMRTGIAGTKVHVEIHGEHGDDHHHKHAHEPEAEHAHGHSHSHGHGHSHGHHHHHEPHTHGHESHSHSHEPKHDHGHDDHHHHHVHLKEVIETVEAAKLGERVTRRAVAAYRCLAEAEAKVHGSTPEKIAFHEVGAKDAIVDVAGAMLGVEMLGIESFSASSIALGNGTVRCAHGVMPVPAPATAELLRGMATHASEIQGELTTPTGAAILRALLAEQSASPVTMKAGSIGYGAGSKVFKNHPNYLRLTLGETVDQGISLPVEREEILILETEVDDMSPQIAGHLMERLLHAGALDVQFSPVQMKKNRPGQRIRVLAATGKSDPLAEIVFRETSTFGLRITRAERFCLARKMEKVETALGSVAVKVGMWGDKILKASPEFEDCRAIAERTGQPLREVMAAAQRAISERFETGVSSRK